MCVVHVLHVYDNYRLMTRASRGPSYRGDGSINKTVTRS